MSAFRLHPHAARELEEIQGYIAADSITSANRIIDELESACARLSKFPLSGHARPDITSDRVRFWRVRSYLIAYVTEIRPVLILGFIHGARNPERIAIILKSRLES